MADINFTKVPKFLRRLFRETSDPSNPDIVWSPEGDHIQIPCKETFIKNTLPTLSRAKEYSAFIRQLNIYGFVKVRNDDREEYYNSFFKRDQPSLMGFMKRVKRYRKVDTQLQLQLPTLESQVSFLSEANYRLNNEVAALRERVESQEHRINGLLDIFSRVFRNGMQNYNYDIGSSNTQADPIYISDHDLLPSINPLSSMSKPLGSLTTVIQNREDDKKHLEDEKKSDKDLFTDINNIFF